MKRPISSKMLEFVTLFREQHKVDMELYERFHQNGLNQSLHCVLIPLETYSFFLFFSVILRSCSIPLVSAVGWSIALVSCLISPTPIGVLAALFHVFICSHGVHLFGRTYMAILVALGLWAMSWGLQVGVGHNWIEGNQPSLAQGDVSLLAMTQSVLMAWRQCAGEEFVA